MPEAQGERMQRGPSCRGAQEGAESATTASRPAPPPGRTPARSPGTGPGGTELLRPTGGWNFPLDGLLFMRVFRLAV